MKYASQHFCNKTMDLGGSDRLGLRGSARFNRPSRIRPSRIRPVLTSLRTPMILTYHEFKAVCLSSM